jgi:hypothetical protein
MREAGGGGLAQQGGDDAPDARQVVAASGAGPMAVGASWRRPALLMLVVLPVLVLVVALAGAGLLGAGALAALLVALRTPVLAPVLAAAVLAGAGALAGAVGGLLAGPGAVDALAARVVGLLEAAPRSSGRSARWSPSSLVRRGAWALAVGLGGEGGIGLELGQQGTAVAGADPGGLGQPSAGDGLAGGDQSGVGGTCTLALALAGGRLLVLDAGRLDRGRVRYSRLSTAKEPSSHTGVAPAVTYPTRVGGATATWSRVDRATEATSSSHDSRSTARWPRRLASSTDTSMASARASVPRGHSSGMARPPARAASTMAP